MPQSLHFGFMSDSAKICNRTADSIKAVYNNLVDLPTFYGGHPLKGWPVCAFPGISFILKRLRFTVATFVPTQFDLTLNTD